MKLRSKITSVLLLFLAGLQTMSARAEDEYINAGPIEVGKIEDHHGAVFLAQETGGKKPERILVGVTFHGFTEKGAPLTTYRMFWVEAGFKFDPNTKEAIGFRVATTPFAIATRKNGQYKGSPVVTTQVIRFAQSEFVQDVDLGSSHATIEAIGYEASSHMEIGGFMKFALGALGASMMQNLKNGNSNWDMHYASIGFNLGVNFTLPYDIVITWDMLHPHWNFNRNGVVAGVYSELSAALSKLTHREAEIRAYARAGQNAVYFYKSESNDDPNRERSYLITGLEVRW